MGEEVNITSQEKIARIQQRATEGMSVREIAKAENTTKWVVTKYTCCLPRPDNISDVPKTPDGRNKKQHFLDCRYCGESFLDKDGEKTSDLKHGKIKHAFCTHRCAMNFRSIARHEDKCKRCKKTRKELAWWTLDNSKYQATGVCFTKGYCGRCYGLLRQYRFKEELVKDHELTQTLKKEIKNERDSQHKRPSQDAIGNDRFSVEGKSRSQAGDLDWESFFADIAIRPVGL